MSSFRAKTARIMRIWGCGMLLTLIPFSYGVDNKYLKSLQKKAGQLMWVGYHNINQIKKIQPSGIVFFGWNIKTAKELQAAVKEIRYQEKSLGMPRALTALDHEGGRVVRLKSGLSSIPDAAALGATRDTELVQKVSFIMSRELRNMGVDINFAPVMDRGDARSFLENRVWGDSADVVTQMTHAFLEGHIQGGTFPFPKHFPGHGPRAFQDAHFIKSVNTQSKEKLIAEDLPPFLQAMRDPRIPAVMTAHVEIEALDRQPASLSKKVISDFLRTELGYSGFILSDDLEMGSVSSQSVDVSELAIQSLKSGVDSVLVVWNQEDQIKVRDRIVRAMIRGELSETDVDQKIARIQNLRERVSQIKLESQKSPSLNYAQKQEILEQAWVNSQSWVLGSEEQLHKNLNSKSKWTVIVPPGSYARVWRAFRPQDRLIRVDSKTGDYGSILKFLDKKSRTREAIVVLSPPMHQDGGEWVRKLAQFFSKSYKDPATTAPMLWVHMGMLPVKVTRNENPAKAFSFLHLNSATTQGLRQFLRVLGSRANSWNSVSQRYSLSLPSPSSY